MSRNKPTPKLLQRLRQHDTPAEHVKDQGEDDARHLLDAANHAVATVGTRHLTFITLCVYVALVVASTTDEMLLRVSPVNMPLLDVEIPIKGFYAIASWLIVLVHLDLLLQFHMLRRKLNVFNAAARLLPHHLTERLRVEVANFAYAYHFSGIDDSRLVRTLLRLIIYTTLLVLPLSLLLCAQLRFISFHNTGITSVQQLAVTADVLLLILFRACILQPAVNLGVHTKPWRTAWAWKTALVGVVYPLVLFFAWSVATVPRNLPVWQEWPWRGLALDCDDSYQQAGPKTDRGPVPRGRLCQVLDWWAARRNLDLKELVLTGNIISPRIQNSLRNGTDQERIKALKDIIGLSLRDRDLRGAQFDRALFPKADLRRAQLDRAQLSEVQLQGADFRQASLQYADLASSQLQGARFEEARLDGSNLRGSNLQRARFQTDGKRATMNRVRLMYTWLQQVYLEGVEMQGADLEGAKLQNANLRGAKLAGATLYRAGLQGANLGGAQLQGANLELAELQGANLEDAQLQGANLNGAKLNGASLDGADLALAELQAIRRGPVTEKDVTEFAEVSTLNAVPAATIEAIVGALRQSVDVDSLDNAKPGLWRCSAEALAFSKSCISVTEWAAFDDLKNALLVAMACHDLDVALGVASYRALNYVGGWDTGLVKALLDAESKEDCEGVAQLPARVKNTFREVVEKVDR